jgi:uncharacterized repeat protein (TIGR03806 family)
MHSPSKSTFKILAPLLGLIFSFYSCQKDYDLVPLSQTVQFEQNLSAYNIYEGEMKNLAPSQDYHLIELSSILYSNYAEKQRLLKLPVGTQMTYKGNGLPEFPDGTILVKTFYYYNNETDTSQGKQIIETRLSIKQQNEWNLVSYLWNADQTEATLQKEGLDTQVSWINSSGTNQTIDYRVPNQEECVKCHQQYARVLPIGPSMRNMNREVVRNNVSLNQLAHLQQENVLSSFAIGDASNIPDYNDLNVSLTDRGRAYLDMNCASCHNPFGLSEAADMDYDFRFETPLSETNILDNKDLIIRVMEEGRMPDVGVTIIDQEGLALVKEYINSL